MKPIAPAPLDKEHQVGLSIFKTLPFLFKSITCVLFCTLCFLFKNISFAFTLFY